MVWGSKDLGKGGSSGLRFWRGVILAFLFGVGMQGGWFRAWEGGMVLGNYMGNLRVKWVYPPVSALYLVLFLMVKTPEQSCSFSVPFYQVPVCHFFSSTEQ